MHATTIKRTRVATAIGGLAAALAAGRRSARPLRCRRTPAARSAMHSRAVRPPRKTSARCGPIRQVCRASRRRRSRRPCTSLRRRSSSATMDRRPRRSSRSAGQEATPARSPSSRICMPRADQFATERGPRRQRAVRTRHRIRRQLARPLPGCQVGHQDDQRQSVAVLARQQHVRGRRRRQLAARRRRAHEKLNYSAALAQAAGQAAAGGLIPASLVPTIVGLTPGLESNAKVEGDDSAWGWNIGFLWDATPQTRVGAHYRSSIKYNVSANVELRSARALPTRCRLAQLAPVVGLLATGVNGVARERRRQGGHRIARHRERFGVPPAERPLGPDGRSAVHALVDVQGAQVRPHDRRRCCRTRPRISTTRGGSRSARRITGTTPGVSAAALHGTSPRSTRRIARRGCRTRTAYGSPSARSTSSTATSRSTPASSTSR